MRIMQSALLWLLALFLEGIIGARFLPWSTLYLIWPALGNLIASPAVGDLIPVGTVRG